jgi:membrane protein DedA with SNARE-associated domain
VEELLVEYGPTVGYIVLLLGSFVEGESVVLTAGFFSYKGYLSLPLIILISFSGSLFADQLLFFLGRIYGPGMLERKPALREKAHKAFALLHRYHIWFILGFRFIYGIRTVSPFVIGASGISVKRFAILNVIAAAIWAVLSCCAGYLLGYFFADEIEYAISQAIKFQKYTVSGILILLTSIAVYLYYRRKKQKKDIDENR